jgi:anti-anti-sigma factor
MLIGTGEIRTPALAACPAPRYPPTRNQPQASQHVDTSPGTIHRTVERDVWVVALRGEHDLSTAPDLRNELDNIYDAGSHVVVDLTGVGFIDSSILSVLIYGCERASEKHEHSFALVAPPDSPATRILDLVVGDRVPRFETLAGAIAALRGAEPG